MSTNDIYQKVGSPSSLVLRQTAAHDSSDVKAGSAAKFSLWSLPGLDKKTFYAAALYLHAAAGEIESEPWARGPHTPEITREFLDSLADCFARSKDRDASDHVSATAMVKKDNERTITLYVAQNRGSNGSTTRFEGNTRDKTMNETFADKLTKWFNTLSSKFAPNNGHEGMFKEMCEFCKSRIEHYISRLSQCKDPGILENAINAESDGKLKTWKDAAGDFKFSKGFNIATKVLNACRKYESEKSETINTLPSMTACVQLAGEARNDHNFREFQDAVKAARTSQTLHDFKVILEGIAYLGRIFSAWTRFSKFCQQDDLKEYEFRIVLLPSEDHEWDGDLYFKLIKSWSGDLDLTRERRVHKPLQNPRFIEPDTIESLIQDILKRGNKAPVHCEMQLMMHFMKPDTDECLDWFGCSKKSCWLCWHMMVNNDRFSMKDTHRKLYPRWAFPFDFSASQPGIAQRLVTTYDKMLFLIRNQAIWRHIPLLVGAQLQSSDRLTPSSLRFSHMPSDGQMSDSEPFSGRIVLVPDRGGTLMGQVSALYIPTDASDMQYKTVTLYPRITYDEAVNGRLKDPGDDSQFIKNWLESQIRRGLLGGHRVIPAFELLTLPAFSKKEDLGTIDLGTITWESQVIWSKDRYGQHICYLMYFRVSANLLPNSRVQKIWRKVHGDEPHLDKFPWRGGLFVFELGVRSPGTEPSFDQNFHKSLEVDADHFLDSLEDSFRRVEPHYIDEVIDQAHKKNRDKVDDLLLEFYMDNIDDFLKENGFVGEK